MAGEPEKDVLADTYDVNDYESDETEEDAKRPPFDNQFSATRFIVGLSTQRGFPYALMGGFAMIPSKRIHGGVIRIFVKTGPGHDSCKDVFEVEVDIVVADKGYSGPRGSPMNIESGRETLQFPEPATRKMITFEVLDLRWLMKTKMSACSDRIALKDYTDLEYLVTTYTDQVRSFIHELDHEQVDHWLDGLDEAVQKDMRAKLGV
ncbi:MAG: hypothetical protein ASARMPRED_003329 [Alectoria sarmentosa]|nr:MAG: hypothetical protein ASARMPRED_003329 [Alectoria sarmentosa]